MWPDYRVMYQEKACNSSFLGLLTDLIEIFQGKKSGLEINVQRYIYKTERNVEFSGGLQKISLFQCRIAQ